MSAVHKPNMNFDNETMVHVPYKVVLQGTFQSAYDRFRRPKPATVETGATVRVPLFINEGETIKVDTRNGSYVERVRV